MKLNAAQLEAVNYIGGPCLVLAGAGSGKTRVITQKIVHLISECSYSARNICAVTFTNKAAKEMKERISAALSPDVIKGLRVSTFHSLGLEIIRHEYYSLGISPNFSLFDEYDSMSVMKEIIEKAQGDLSKDELKNKCIYWLGAVSRFKNDLRSPEEILEDRDPESQIAGLIYSEYQHMMNSCNAIDFDDLIYRTVRLFRSNQDVLTRWRSRIRYLLVDEYQDTNQSQYELIRLLVSENQRFTVVGDDDQSIYSWRGAQPENIPRLRKDFPNLRVIMLEENYRSCGRILKCANALIAHNPHEYIKKLHSGLEFGKPIRVIEIPKADQEGKKLVTDLLGHHYRYRTRFQDYAVLYRGNYQSREIQKALAESNIPYRVIGGTSFFALSEIKDFMCYLRVLVNDDDNRAFLRIINTPRREIGAVALEHIGKFAESCSISLMQACMDPRLRENIPAREAGKFMGFAELVMKLRKDLSGSHAHEILRALPDTLGYTDWLRTDSGSEKSAEFRIDNVMTLVDWVERSMSGGPDSDDGPLSFEEAVTRMALRELLDREEQDFELDEVQLMTLHSSKGLEFPFVYMIGMEEGLLPHKSAVETGNVEEERRLAYVGMTRARQELTFMLCQERKSRDQRDRVCPEPSRFLKELPAEDLDWKENGSLMTRQERSDMLDAFFKDAQAFLDRQ
ncbi:UvrD-helicase domain-containing protein [Succinimonas amylolytica]|uniref:UvrD-helicase domain-containing protein n=1 Tax=Succinimonas amylolytica TaxID=83769 RepID=UPI0003773958|nr:UvrD-helicase domain-containing protein [Succinimonas amylolytica]